MALELNKYPKDQLEELLHAVTNTMKEDRPTNGYLQVWFERINEAIDDQKFDNKQLNF